MRTTDEKVLFSTSDLINFSRCQYLSMIDFEAMSKPALLSQKVESSDYKQMIQDNGKKHQLECWDELRK